MPILVGGTGLYIEAVTYDYRVPPVKQDAELRQKYHALAENKAMKPSISELAKVDPITANRLHPNDRKRVIRALEVYHLSGKPFSAFVQAKKPYYDSMVWIGLTMPRDNCMSESIDVSII